MLKGESLLHVGDSGRIRTLTEDKQGATCRRVAEQCRPAEESMRENVTLLKGLGKIYVISKAVAIMTECDILCSLLFS